jgi:L-lactate utilization protein LutC
VSRAECLARFQEELSALGVESHLETTQDCVQRRVTTLLAGRRVLSWDREALPYALGSIVGDAVFAGDPRDAQAAAEVGLTGCDAAIAETGSLVLLSGPGRSRAVSLLPPVHLAVVRSEDLCFSLGDVFRTHAGRLSQAASCTLITGPSRTADIELTLTLGVHGPGTVLVVIGP